jgi:hypothetical protein
MNLTLTDRTIIGRIGRHVVLAAMHEVAMRDGTLHRFHRVCDGVEPCVFHRAMRLDDKRSFVVFDLRDIHRMLGAELPPCPDRDVPGVIMFNLREKYVTGQALRMAIAEKSSAIGVPVPAAEAVPA